MDNAGDGDGPEVGAGGDDPRPAALAREYYRALDDEDYDALAGVLAADFVHERPDQTLDGRERFVRFMREERPQTDTTHPIDGVYDAASGAERWSGSEGGAASGGVSEVVVRGRLLAADGAEITAFVDVFRVEDGALQGLRTFTH